MINLFSNNSINFWTKGGVLEETLQWKLIVLSITNSQSESVMFMHGTLLARLLHWHDWVQCTWDLRPVERSIALPADKFHATFWNWMKWHQNRKASAVLIFPAHRPSAMAGLVANSLYVSIPYSDNGLSMCSFSASIVGGGNAHAMKCAWKQAQVNIQSLSQ